MDNVESRLLSLDCYTIHNHHFEREKQKAPSFEGAFLELLMYYELTLGGVIRTARLATSKGDGERVLTSLASCRNRDPKR